MNKYFLLIFVVCFTAACGNNKTDESAIDDNTVEAASVFYKWEAVDSNGILVMKKIEDEQADTLSPATVVTYLNQSNSNVQLVLLRISGDTVYVKIPDATYLTQQQGSAGATMILAGIVYNLTEIPGISHVNLDFAEGDHAVPGTYDRDTFKND